MKSLLVLIVFSSWGQLLGPAIRGTIINANPSLLAQPQKVLTIPSYTISAGDPIGTSSIGQGLAGQGPVDQSLQGSGAFDRGKIATDSQRNLAEYLKVVEELQKASELAAFLEREVQRVRQSNYFDLVTAEHRDLEAQLSMLVERLEVVTVSADKKETAKVASDLEAKLSLATNSLWALSPSYVPVEDPPKIRLGPPGGNYAAKRSNVS